MATAKLKQRVIGFLLLFILVLACAPFLLQMSHRHATSSLASLAKIPSPPAVPEASVSQTQQLIEAKLKAAKAAGAGAIEAPISVVSAEAPGRQAQAVAVSAAHAAVQGAERRSAPVTSPRVVHAPNPSAASQGQTASQGSAAASAGRHLSHAVITPLTSAGVAKVASASAAVAHATMQSPAATKAIKTKFTPANTSLSASSKGTVAKSKSASLSKAATTSPASAMSAKHLQTTSVQLHPARKAITAHLRRPAQKLKAEVMAKPTRVWVVQLGSFSHRDNAQRLVQQLKKSGFAAYLRSSKAPNGQLYRVLVGPVLKKRNAKSMAKTLERRLHLQGLVMKSFDPIHD